jgi:hypothetical protein
MFCRYIQFNYIHDVSLFKNTSNLKQRYNLGNEIPSIVLSEYIDRRKSNIKVFIIEILITKN